MKIPCYVVTGYLGAGKTTLLNHLLVNTSVKLAVIVNEFGSVPVDGKIIRGKSVTMTELAGGCVCCSMSGELDEAVKEIISKVKPEAIVIETTGVAEPAALEDEFFASNKDVFLSAIITIADADALVRYPSLGHTGRQQIERADILVVNKTDLITLSQCEELSDALKKLNSHARYFYTKKCDVDVPLLLGMKHERIAHDVKKSSDSHENPHEYFSVDMPGKFLHSDLKRIFGQLPPSVYRAKGFVKTDRGTELVQYVAGRVEITPGESKEFSLVFIGVDILKDKKKIEELFI